MAPSANLPGQAGADLGRSGASFRRGAEQRDVRSECDERTLQGSQGGRPDPGQGLECSIQSLIREHILTHTHGGGDSGSEIDVDLRSLALGSELAVRKLEASDSLLVGPGSQPVLAVNPKATNTEGSYQVSVAGTLRAEQVRTARLDGVTSLAAGEPGRQRQRRHRHGGGGRRQAQDRGR